MIILEGIDGSGKTTLANKLKEHGYFDLHFAHDPENKDLFTKYSKILDVPNSQNLILDRSFISEFVYGTVLRGVSRLNESQIRMLAQKYARKDGKVIYLVASYNTLLKRRSKENKDLKTLQKHYKELNNSYEYIMKSLQNSIKIYKFNTDLKSTDQIIKDLNLLKNK